MASVVQLVSMNAQVFVMGVLDTISIHKTIPILVNDRPTFLLTLQVLTANLFLLLGSILIFRRGINPIMNLLVENVTEENNVPGNFFDQVVWFIYQTFWLIPVCILCYGCSAAWYQELADTTYKYLKGLPKKSNIAKTVGFVLYATLIWFFVFIQCQLLCNLSPVVMNQLIHVVNVLFSSRTEDHIVAVFLLNFIKHALLLALNAVRLGLQVAGLTLMCLLYGWYGFDPQWISSNVHPDTRFSLMETHWAYFLGFGFPYVLIIKNTSFFVGYGIFLALFPFCIMLGTVSSYAEPYKGFDKETIVPVRFFTLAKKWTLSTLKRIDSTSYQSHQKSSKSSKSTGSAGGDKKEGKDEKVADDKKKNEKKSSIEEKKNVTEKGKREEKEKSSELPTKEKPKDQ